MGKLVDFGAGGVGVETFLRLPSGALVRVRGDLRSPELSLNIDALARVAHSTEISPGLFRAGLQLVEAAFAKAS